MSSAIAWNGPWDGGFIGRGGRAEPDARRAHRAAAREARRERHAAEGREHRHGHHQDDHYRMHHDGRGGRGRNRHGGHRGGPGFGGPWSWPGGMPPMPPMPPGPPGTHPFGRGRRAQRGDVRAAILALLAEGPLNGYQVMQAIGERSQGAWRPSPGAVYPALQQLADEGLIQQTGEGRRTRYELTGEGTTYIAEHADEVNAPWEAMTPQIDEDVQELMELAQQSNTALMQVIQSASPAQLARAKKVVSDGRRRLYQILADGDSEPAGDGDES